MAARVFAVTSSVTGSSSNANFVHTTRWMMSLSTPYGQSLYRMRMSSSELSDECFVFEQNPGLHARETYRRIQRVGREAAGQIDCHRPNVTVL